MSATGYGPEKWAELGCAKAFDDCWNAKVRDKEAIYTFCLAVMGKVDKILNV
jgi:hypothetical protein